MTESVSKPSGSSSRSSGLLDDDRGARNLIEQMNLICALKDSDNRKILWLAMNTPAWKSTLDVWDVQHEIFGEIENRLFPEYDGENVTFEDWGWKTPEGEIRYMGKSSNAELCHRDEPVAVTKTQQR